VHRLLVLLLLLCAASPAAAAGDWWLVFEERSRNRQSLILADASSIERQGDRVAIAFALVVSHEPTRSLSGGVLRIELLCSGRQMRLVRLEAVPGVALPRMAPDRPGAFEPFEGNEADPVLRFACAGERGGFTHLPGVTGVAAEAERLFAEARRPPSPPAPLGAAERERRERSWALQVEGTIRRSLARLCGEDVRCRGFEPEGTRGAAPAVAVEDLVCTEEAAEQPAWMQPPERLQCRFTVRAPRTGRRAACTVALLRPFAGLWTTMRTRPTPPQPMPTEPPFPMAPTPEETLACTAPLLPLAGD
jgi:hypothetical protein